MKNKEPKFSESIEAIIRMLEDAQKDFEWSGEKVHEMDMATQDYLHKLELDGLKYDERAKVATKLMKCRQTRRQHKDTVVVLEPLVEYLATENGKNMMKYLREALGKTRKTEARMENRMYFPRVVKEDK